MSGLLFITALVVGQQTEPSVDPTPSVDVTPLPPEAPAPEVTPAVEPAAAPEAPPDVPTREPTTPTPTVASPTVAPTVETRAPPEDLRDRWVGAGLTAGCLGVGSPTALLLGVAAALPMAGLGCCCWARLAGLNDVPGYARWYDAFQAAPLFLPVLLLGTCLAAPVGVLVTLGASLVGVLALRKPTLAAVRSAWVAAVPGALWGWVPGGVVLAGLLSTTVLVASLLVFWMSYSPSLGPLSLGDPRLWHQVNNLACCLIGVSLCTTPLLLAAWPASLLGVVAASAWTAWRTGKARANSTPPCEPGADCQHGDAP